MTILIDAPEATVSQLAAALRYASLGWPVFPLHTPTSSGCSCASAQCGSIGKHPRTSDGFKSATTEEARIRRWWRTWPSANIGIATGARSAFFVVDVDPDKGGDAAIAQLMSKHGALPPTVEALTGSGGRHILFRHPGQTVPNSTRKLGPGLDVRGDGGYIVAAPSLHKAGTTYEWQPGCAPGQHELAAAPEWLLELLRPSASAPKVSAAPASSADNAYRRAQAYITRMPEAISGDRGHDSLWKVTLALVRGFRLSESEALALLSNDYNPRCSPPWAEKELLHKVRDAAAHSQLPYGYLLDAERAAARPAAAPRRDEPGCDDDDERPAIAAIAPPAMLSRRISLERAKSPPAEHFIVGPLFPFGKASVVYGPQGAGKSALLSQLALKVASGGGGAFLGMLMHDQEGGAVLVYSAEDTFEDWERKAAAVLHSCPDVDVPRALERLHIVDKTEGIARLTELVQVRSDLGNEAVTRREPRATAERSALIAHARQLQARLVIIETASRLVDDEDNANFAALLAACGHIAAETGAAVLLSHHPTKNAAKDNDSSPEGARGGSAFINNSRTAVSLFPARPEHVAKLADQGLHFAEKDVLVLEHQKGTSSVPRQDPIVVVRCPTPHGAVLQLPKFVAADPTMAAAHARRAQREQQAHAAQLTALHDLVAELRASDAVSKNKLRPHAARLGVTKKNEAVDALVDRAIAAGVLKAGRRDSAGRLLSLELGTRPDQPAAHTFDARATRGDPEHGSAD